MTKRRAFLLAGLALLPAGCAGGYGGYGGPTTMLDPRADRSAIGLGLDSRDFESAAAKIVQDMLESPVMVKPSGGRWVMVVSRVTNDTMQRIDTDLLIRRIRQELLRSGKVVTSTAVGLDGAEDPMRMRLAQLRGSREFSQQGAPRAGQMAIPELSLAGKLVQQNNRLGDGSQRVDYAFMLTVSDQRGLAIWEGVEPISKLGSNRTVSW